MSDKGASAWMDTTVNENALGPIGVPSQKGQTVRATAPALHLGRYHLALTLLTLSLAVMSSLCTEEVTDAGPRRGRPVLSWGACRP